MKNNQDFSLEALKLAYSEFIAGKPSNLPNSEDINKAISEVFGEYSDTAYEELKSKVLSGYQYQIKIKDSTISTGIGGIKLCLKAGKESGVPAMFYAKSIKVLTDNHGWQPLGLLKVKNLKDGK